MIDPDRGAALARLDAEVRGQSGRGRWLVLTHDNPDPDALASGALLARLLRQRYRRQVTIAYGGIIGRAENQEMVRALRLELSPVRSLSWRRFRHVALVDTQPETGNNALPADRPPDLVFDHHPARRASTTAAYADIRPDYGATATLIAEYLEAAEIPLGRVEASALIYAIRTETLDFRREAAEPDRRQFDRAFPIADKRALARISNPRLPFGYFQVLHRALENLEAVGTLIVSHLGELEHPDLVPEIADLLVRMETRTWSFVSGAWQDRVYLSLRTTNPRGDAGRLMRRLVGRHGKGGGHGMLAGGWVPVTAGSRSGAAADIHRRLARRVATALRKDPNRLAPLPLAPLAEEAGATD